MRKYNYVKNLTLPNDKLKIMYINEEKLSINKFFLWVIMSLIFLSNILILNFMNKKNMIEIINF